MMNWFSKLLGKAEKRNAPTSWDLLRAGPVFDTSSGVLVNHVAAENISAVAGAVQCISETCASIAMHVYRKLTDGRSVVPDHPIARLLGPNGDANDWQSSFEFLEMQTATTLLRGNSYAIIQRDGRGAPAQLVPMSPDLVQVVKIQNTGRHAYDVSTERGTTRYLPEDILHLRDRADGDGLVGRSRLERARETFGTALATERYASRTFVGGGQLAGVLTHPGELSADASDRLRKSWQDVHGGVDNAGKVAILEEAMRFTPISAKPDETQALESRRFTVEQIARIFRVPPPLLGHMEDSNYSSVSELGRWFISYSIVPWLRRWESTIERSLLSTEGRRQFEIEFDCDELLRGDYLTRMQAFRVGREISLYSQNDLRRFERLPPVGPEGDTFLSPLNMNSEQTGRPRGDRGGDE